MRVRYSMGQRPGEPDHITTQLGNNDSLGDSARKGFKKTRGIQ